MAGLVSHCQGPCLVIEDILVGLQIPCYSEGDLTKATCRFQGVSVTLGFYMAAEMFPNPVLSPFIPPIHPARSLQFPSPPLTFHPKRLVYFPFPGISIVSALSLSGYVDCSSIPISLTTNVRLQVNTYHVCLSGSGFAQLLFSKQTCLER